MAALAIGLGTIWLDMHVLKGVELPVLLYSGGNEDAKALLAILLSSVITITTLSISLTFVVLSLGASQMGPRLIRSFMGDGWTQGIVGLFFAIIVYCFVVMSALHVERLESTLPSLSINLAALFAFMALFVMLFFVHHVALSSMSDTVIRRVSAELLQAIDRLSFLSKKRVSREVCRNEWPAEFNKKADCLFFKRSGYIQRIGYNELCYLAQQHNLYIRLDFSPGRFVLNGQGGVFVFPKERLDDESRAAILAAVLIGEERTPAQDIEYSMRHLVEVAIRALGPSNRDPYTAMTVVDHLSVAMVRLFSVLRPDNDYHDTKGLLRVTGMALSDEDLVNAAFSQIRQESIGQPDILIHLLYAFEAIAYSAVRPEQKEALREQASLIRNHFAENPDICEIDRKHIEKAYMNAVKILQDSG
jgi:uncharacterized membrane protein